MGQEEDEEQIEIGVTVVPLMGPIRSVYLRGKKWPCATDFARRADLEVFLPKHALTGLSARALESSDQRIRGLRVEDEETSR